MFDNDIQKVDTFHTRNLTSAGRAVSARNAGTARGVDDGLSYKLRHCETGKEKRSFIHYNRLKPYNAERDLFYSKHQLVSDTLKRSADSLSNEDGTNLQDDWFEIDSHQ